MSKKTVKRYAWDPGVRTNVSAEVAGPCIDQLRNERGEVTPIALVDAAKDRQHPMHPCFEWNDGAAAQAYREGEARRLLRGLRIIEVVVSKGGEEKQARIAYVNVRYKGEDEKQTSVYVDTVAALLKDDSREFVLHQALAQLRGFRRRYESLKELAGVFQEINKLEHLDKPAAKRVASS